jgi:general stress protein 26
MSHHTSDHHPSNGASSPEKTRTLFELMKALDFAMLVTQPKAGLRARPMSTIVDVEAESVHMLTSRSSAKDDEIDENADVLLTFSNGAQKNVVLQARAAVIDDRSLVKALWNPGAQAFWPNGPMDPDIVALKLTPVAGEYWEGNSGVIAAFKFASAIATGREVDAGTNEKVAL